MSYIGAPYNFIPFEKKANAPISKSDLETHDKIDDELLTGEITYQIKAETPIIIDDGKGDFFRNEYGKYAIPGSTVRGLLRNNAQILSASSFDNDIDDYRLMFRNVASGALKNEYNRDYLGNKPVSYGKGTISVLMNVKGGAITCSSGEYYIYPTKVERVDNNMPNYYVLSERTIVDDYLKNGDDFSYDLFIENGKSILQNRIDIKFERSVRNERVHYTQKPKEVAYKPYFKECSYIASGKNITAASSPEKYRDKGMVISTGKMNEKKAVYIIPEIDMDKRRALLISKEDIKAYNIDYNKKENTLRSFFGKDKKKAGKEAKAFYGLPGEGEIKPVFYIYLKGRLYFGFTPRLRVFYDYSLKNGYRQELPKDTFDMSTSLFGMSDKDKGSYKSKVSVSDAVMVDGKQEGTRKIVLAEPKPTSYLDYVVQSDDNYKKIQTYNSDDFELRGVKQYWLRNNLYHGNQSNNENIGSEINPLSAGSIFSGKIRFDNLTNTELGLLLWSLRLEQDSSMNIGKGKPYGYGRIQIYDIRTKIRDNRLAYSLDALQLNPYRETDPDSYINVYKKVLVNGVKVTELASVKIFLKMKDSKSLPNPDAIRYMSIDAREYQNRKRRLENVDEVLRGRINVSNSSEKPADKRHAENLEMGQIYAGEVIGHNPSGFFAKVSLKNGKKASFRDKRNLSVGTKVSLIYKGKDENGYDQWELT